MSSSGREPRLPWLPSLTGAEGVPLIPHRPVVLLGCAAFQQLLLAVYSLCTEPVLTREHGNAGLTDLSMQDASALVKQPRSINRLAVVYLLSLDLGVRW